MPLSKERGALSGSVIEANDTPLNNVNNPSTATPGVGGGPHHQAPSLGY